MTTKRRQPTLTPRKRDILVYIDDHRRMWGYSPTLREIAARWRKSPATIHEHIDELVANGCLTRLPDKARSLQLTRKALGLIQPSPA